MRNTHRSVRILTFALLALTLLLVPPILAQTRPAERFGMTGQQFERFQQEAERMGLTPEQLRRFIHMELGTPLVHDRRHKVAVGAKTDERDGSLRALIVFPDPSGEQDAALSYELGPELGRGTVTYSSAPARSGQPPRRSLVGSQR